LRRVVTHRPVGSKDKGSMTVFSPTLRQLRFLVALDTERHFGRAAAAMGVGQSTLSAGIAELERLVGVVLVERTKRSVRFTDVGEAFVLRARNVVGAAAELTEFAATAAQPLTGPLRLGIIPTVAPFLLPRILTPIRLAFPALVLYLREQTSEAACAALRRGMLDAVILALPYDCGPIEHEEILRDPLVLATPRDWGPAPRDPQSLLLLEEGHCLNEHGLIACGVPRVRSAAMVATSLQTLVEMVEARLGTTFLPQMAIRAGLLEGRAIDTVPLGTGAERQIVLAWRQGSARGDEFRLLARTVRDAATHLPQNQVRINRLLNSD
jgi:LysR family transcriptional regulator, hydrogen peroxide-inducible genes activator